MLETSPDPDALIKAHREARITQWRAEKRDRLGRQARETAKCQRYAADQPEDEAEALEFNQRRESERKRRREQREWYVSMAPAMEKAQEERDRSVAGLDLVLIALQDPGQLDEVQRGALLGCPPFPPVVAAFVSRLSGFRSHRRSKWQRAEPEFALGFPDPLLQVASGELRWTSPTICKFFLCDRRVPDGFDPRSEHSSINLDAAVEDQYREQLRLESTNDPLERARAAVRGEVEQKAKHYAARMLLALEDSERAGFKPNFEELEKQACSVAP